MSSSTWTQRQDGSYTPRSFTPSQHEEAEQILRSSSSGVPSPTQDTPFLPSDGATPRVTMPRSLSSNFVSSPLNPATPLAPSISPFARSRSASRGSMYLSRMTSDEAQAISSPSPFGSTGNRGSMVLYRLAGEDEFGMLVPPRSLNNRDSVASTDSVVSVSDDSKYPSGFNGTVRGMIPYAYDPDDDNEPLDEEDDLHDPNNKSKRSTIFAARGFLNVGVLVLLVLGLISLFMVYPVVTFFRDNARNVAIGGNININQTGQAPDLFQLPQLIDIDTPADAQTRTGFDGQEYELVFSDEFNVEGRTFYPGDDPYWEAVDIWYGATGDLEWYDPGQVTTRNGSLRILMENIQTHGLQYRSGMLQSWNKFCFSSGYIEVAVTMPGPNEETRGYWPGVWTMGNLGRPGYAATTDGTWPYTYDQCDVGTFPNQTLKDKSGPAAALHSNAGRAKYNYELSWLPGQRVSACTCSGEDHPGPTTSKGRGAPEIDVLEVEHNKLGNGQVSSQSAQFAPFTADYVSDQSTTSNFQVFNTTMTTVNTYVGSALQQAVSTLSRLPADMFQGSGQVFHKMGFEYWANPKNQDEGFISWQVDGQQSARLGAGAVGPDQGATGSGVSRRIIPEEPMSIILNMGISPNWQTIDLTTMVFPAEMLVDYVRVYQRKGHTNIGCDPVDYPTLDYINRHLDSYSNPNLTAWNHQWPKNGLYEGGC